MTEEEKILKSFYQELEKVKTDAKKEYNQGKMEFDQADIVKRVAQSQYLIDFKNIEMDKKWLESVFKEYLSVLKRFKRKKEVVVEKLEEAFEQKKLDLEALIKKTFSFDTGYMDALSQKLTLNIEDLNFLGLHLGNPIFGLYAEKLKGRFDPGNWLKGFCPVCGSLPAMAYLREDDGKRILWCQFCGTEWNFFRLKCPFCSNEDQKTLRYFFTDEKDPHRVYVCDKCKKYVKTIDQRKMEKPEDLELGWENLSTLTMDLVAQKEGFKNLYSQPPGKKKGVII